MLAARVAAEETFRVLRREEGPKTYGAVFAKSEPVIGTAMSLTGDLMQVTPALLVVHPRLWNVLRYFCAPPISEEDLWTMVGHKFKTMRDTDAPASSSDFRDLFDRHRFPWIDQGRLPSPDQREAAILATACVYSTEQLRTVRRGSSSRVQELAVADALTSAGFQMTSVKEKLKPIRVPDELKRGFFSRERKVWDAKCDVPVRLYDGRLLAIECKVSNGPKNSWKRLSREVGGKSEQWRGAFASQLITAAVLAGVFDLSCLRAAQGSGVYLFWQHDLKPLAKFVNDAR